MSASQDKTGPVIAPGPSLMRTDAWDDYALLDSGGGRKLERYGRAVVIRPEPQCLWRPALGESEWARADAVFEPTDEEEAGRWKRLRDLPDTWPLCWRDLTLNVRLSAFRHLGLFPEQAANWSWIADHVPRLGPGAKVLNLFGYTGAASLAAAAAGCSVTHVDASKKAVAWARENAALSGLEGAPIRWICEDARRYAQRELRRGTRYDAIILDPPKYGRGPTGEVWRLYEDLPPLLEVLTQLLSDRAGFLLLNAYSERLSGYALAGLMGSLMPDRGGRIDWGELGLREASGRYGVGLSFFARWSSW